MNKKKILFVSYGGGHIELIKTIIDNAIDFEKYEVDLLALTVAYDKIENSKINKYRISDFAYLFNEEMTLINKYGTELLEENFNPNSKMPISEIVFYLGVSYLDLVNEFGEMQAHKLYKSKKRQSFNPKQTLKRIIKHLSPDFLFTTNSPRMESASIYAAKELNIQSIQILDLFGDDYPIPSADFIIVMNEFVKNKLEISGIDKNILALGQPIFDKTISEVSKIDIESLRENFGYQGSDRIILFCPTPYYYWNDDLSVKGIGEQKLINVPMFKILENLCAKFGVKIILRPHPVSDSIENYKEYLVKSNFIKHYSDLSLSQSLAISDVILTYNSTIAIQAAVCNKHVFTYNYDENQKYFWDNYRVEPFIYSNNFIDLEKNLMNYFIKNSTQKFNEKFYELGAHERISNFINNILWNS
jgi:hypothetical protein